MKGKEKHKKQILFTPIKHFCMQNWLFISIYLISVIATSWLPFKLSVQMSNLLEKAVELTFHLQDGLILILLILLYAIFIMIELHLSGKLIAKCQGYLIKDQLTYQLKNYRHIIYHNENTLTQGQKIVTQSKTIATFYINTFIKGILALIMCLVIALKLFNMSKVISLLLIITSVIVILIMLSLNQLMTKRQKAYVDIASKYFALSDNYIQNIEQIKFHDLFNYCYQQLIIKGDKLIKYCLAAFNIELKETLLVNLLQYGFIAIYICVLLMNPHFNVGNMMLIISTLTLYFNYIYRIKDLLIDLQKINVAIEIFEKEKLEINSINLSQINQIELQDFKSTYQKCSAMNYCFKSNNVYLIQGENGVGKSSFFKALLGLDLEYSGNIMMNHQSIKGKDLMSLYTHSLFYIDQNCDLIEYVDTKDENINLSRGQIQQFLLQELFNHKKIEHSLILLDEPSASLDQMAKEKLVHFIQQLKSCHNIVMIISHDPFMEQPDYVKVRFE